MNVKAMVKSLPYSEITKESDSKYYFIFTDWYYFSLIKNIIAYIVPDKSKVWSKFYGQFRIENDKKRENSGNSSMSWSLSI